MEVGITPTPEMLGRGLLLAGFAARTEPATGIHDPLAARAVVVEDTAIVVVDVIGLHEETSARIRARCALPDANVVVLATHTHGAPASVPGRLGAEPDADFLRSLEDACVAAIDGACDARRPVTLTVGQGDDPGIARNRRHAGGAVDGVVPILRLRRDDGSVVAVIVAYACHPVVLGADNRSITSDYPHYVRERLRRAHPEAAILFLTGCAGDANTGHSAQDSLSLRENDARSFATAEKVGVAIADAALSALEQPSTGRSRRVTSRSSSTSLGARSTCRPSRAGGEPKPRLPARSGAWCSSTGSDGPRNTPTRLRGPGPHAFRSCDGPVCGSSRCRARSLPGPGCRSGRPAVHTAFVLGYAESFPGYIPPAEEYPFGGYEVEEAHRFIGMPAAFAPGSAERLAAAALELLATDGASDVSGAAG